MEIVEAKTDQEIRECYAVVMLLGGSRATLSENQFTAQVKRQRENDNYTLVVLKDEGEIKLVAGYRFSEFLCFGKHIYLNDLVTVEGKRSQGYGTFFMDWLEKKAKDNDCKSIELTSGIQRPKAHKFYFKHDYCITDFHFGKEIK